VSNGVVSWDIGSVVANGYGDLYLTLHVTDTASGGDVVTNTVAITTTNDDTYPGNNVAIYTSTLAAPIREAKVDKVFTCGPKMALLQQALPEELRGLHAKDSVELAEALTDHVHAGDVVMVKGSAGSRMGQVVEALRALNQTPLKAANGC